MKARSTAELDLYIAEHPCSQCGTPPREADLHVKTAVTAGGAHHTYSGSCRKCGNPLHFEIDGPSEWPDLPAFVYGGDQPSQLFAPDQLLAIAEREARAVPAQPDPGKPTLFFEHSARLGRAIGLIDEVRKFIPAGGDAVPEAAFTGPAGAADRRAHADRYRRGWLDQRIAELRGLRQRYTAQAGAAGQQAATAPPAPLKIRFGSESLAAHKQWLQRGRTGEGRMVLEDEQLGDLRIGDVKLAGARLVRVRLDRVVADFADLRGAELVDCSAEGSNFTHAKLDDAVLEGCRFTAARMALTSLCDARIEGGVFREASADRGSWNRLTARRVDFRDTLFGDCILDGALLEDCDLRGARLGRVHELLTDLCSTMNTTFRRCDLRGADLAGRRFDGTRFIDCKLAGVTGVPVIEGDYLVERPDFSAAGDGSDVRTAAAVHALWGKPR